MDAYIIGTACTRFAKRPDTSFKELTREVFLAVLEDAALDDGGPIENTWFGNCRMDMFGQPSIRGQVCLQPLVKEGLFPERVGVINVEGACSSGSLAFHGAWKDVLSGTSHLSLALGVEKTFVRDDPARQLELFTAGLDQFDPQEWQAYYAKAGEEIGRPFAPTTTGGTVNMETYAMQAAYHMARYGTTQRQLAAAASKNHHHGSLNPKAQYRFEVSIEDALADRVIAYPLTRSMCAPIGDGASGALICSAAYLAGQPRRVRERAVKIKASTLSGGKYRTLAEPGLSRVAAQKAYSMAGLKPSDIDLAEIHDATSFGDIYQAEMLGFCEEGAGGKFIESGSATLGGRLPMNVSGGLVSKGHPIAATGMSMIQELCLQLRHEAGERQVKGARFALAENGGGTMGFDEAVCTINILEAPV